MDSAAKRQHGEARQIGSRGGETHERLSAPLEALNRPALQGHVNVHILPVQAVAWDHWPYFIL